MKCHTSLRFYDDFIYKKSDQPLEGLRHRKSKTPEFEELSFNPTTQIQPKSQPAKTISTPVSIDLTQLPDPVKNEYDPQNDTTSKYSR